MDPRWPLEAKRSAFTVLELLVVIGIIVIVAAWVTVASGLARERSRQATCASNLHQIGMALATYRSENDGSDVTGGPQTAAELGLPYYMLSLLPYIRNTAVLRCPDEDWAAVLPGLQPSSSYAWAPAPDDSPGPRFSDAVARRGESTVVAACPHHDLPRNQPGPAATEGEGTVIVLRLSGQADRRIQPRSLSMREW